MNRTDKNVQPAPPRDTRGYPEFDADQPLENAGAPLHQGHRFDTSRGSAPPATPDSSDATAQPGEASRESSAGRAAAARP